jgi:serine phosphatase RsbU (regulator of sigma subunit)
MLQIDDTLAGNSWPVAPGLKSADIVQPLFKSVAGADVDESHLTEYKGDKMPIGVYLRMEPFTQQVIQVEPGDCFYMMSDGLQDQFGGKDYKKFSSRRLKNLLINMARQPMTDQKEMLIKEFNEWKGDYQQLDDICILGIRAGKPE